MLILSGIVWQNHHSVYSRSYVIHGSKIHVESGQILLTLQLSVNDYDVSTCLRAGALPSKHGAMKQCCFNVGPASQTMAQH